MTKETTSPIITNNQISFKGKITEREQEYLFKFLNNVKQILSTNQSCEIVFDLSQTYWIATEQMVFLISWWRRLKGYIAQKKKADVKYDVQLKVILPRPAYGEEISSGNRLAFKREMLQKRLIGTWGVEENTKLAEELTNRMSNLYTKAAEQKFQDLNYQKIIPFQTIQIQDRCSAETIDRKFNLEVNPFFNLDAKVSAMLDKYSSRTAFANKALSHIITHELYLNAYHHAYRKGEKNKECYLAIALTNRFDKAEIRKYQSSKNAYRIARQQNIPFDDAVKFAEPVQQSLVDFIFQEKLKRLPEIYMSEREPETLQFYKSLNSTKKDSDIAFKNESFLEFTYIDFGEGIPRTLQKEYEKKVENQSSYYLNDLSEVHNLQNVDTRILEFAFLESASRSPIDLKIENHKRIPRGLYFLVDTVRKYSGMIIARSNRGKIVYNFSNPNIDIKKCVRFSENDDILEDFKGTLISIIIPTIPSSKSNTTAALPSYKISPALYDEKETKIAYINICSLHERILAKLRDEEEQYFPFLKMTYNQILGALDSELDKWRNKSVIVLIDFLGFSVKSIGEKILYYLATTPKVNEQTKIVIVNYADDNTLDKVRNFMFANSDTRDKNHEPFLYRAIPCLNIPALREKKISWIGIKRKEDELYLSQIFKTDFTFSTLPSSENKDKLKFELAGHAFKIEESGGLISLIPPLVTIEKVYYHSLQTELNNFVQNNTIKGGKNFVFLTSRGNYQSEFISLYETLHNKNIAQLISCVLLNRYVTKWKSVHREKSTRIFNCIVSVTVSSQIVAIAIKNALKDNPDFIKLRQGLTDEGLDEPKLIRLASYYSFDGEEPFYKLTPKDKVLIVIDVISTGTLIFKIIEKIKAKGAEVVCVMNIADTRLPDSMLGTGLKKEVKSEFRSNIEKEIFITLVTSVKIHKPESNIHGIRDIRRINPVLNTVVEMPARESEESQLLFPKSEQLVNLIPPANLRMGHFVMNTTHNSYFLLAREFFSSAEGYSLLSALKKKLDEREGTRRQHIKLNKIYGIAAELERGFLKIRNDEYGQMAQEKGKLAFDMLNRIKEEISKNVDEIIKNGNKVTNVNILEHLVEELLMAGLQSHFNEQFYKLKTLIAELVHHISENDGLEYFEPDYIFYPVYSGAEYIDPHKLADIFNCFEECILPLQRFDTYKGWRFTFPPKIYNRPLKNRSVLILDSGSLTGESLIQMVDSISFLEVSRITVLSVIGRIEDFEREFYSRVKEFKVKHLKTKLEKELGTVNNLKDSERPIEPESIIPIDIYFGTNLHIPVYPSSVSCPYCQELQRLDEYQNTFDQDPRNENRVQKYIKARKLEIDRRTIEDKSDLPDYLPSDINSGQPHYEKMFVMRDRLGKIDGYRFYPEYYSYFNKLELRVEAKENCGQEIELLIALINHEGRLIETVRDLLPKTNQILNGYCEEIINGKTTETGLFYKWTKYGILKFLSVSNPKFFFTKSKLLKLFEYVSDDKKGLEFIEFFLWEALMNFHENLNLKADAENVIKQFKSLIEQPQNMNFNYYEIIKFLVRSHHESKATSEFEAFKNLEWFYFKEGTELKHTQIEQDLQGLYLDFKNEERNDWQTLSNLEFRLETILNVINQLIISNFKVLNKDGFLQKYLKSLHYLVFETTDSLISLVDEIDHQSKIFKEKIQDIRNFVGSNEDQEMLSIEIITIRLNMGALCKLTT